METIPPAGLAPTLPPPAPHRARRAVQLAAVGLALLLGAVLWRMDPSAPGAHLFAYDDDQRIGAFAQRLMFGVSFVVTAAGAVQAVAAWRLARGAAAIALALVAAWAAVCGWVVLGF